MAKNITKKSADKKNLAQTGSEQLFPFGLTSFEEIDNILNGYFNRNWLRSFRSDTTRLDDLWGTYEMRSPSMDIIDNENEIIYRAELPGVDKKDLDVSVSENLLTIKGSSKMESEEEKGNYHSSEIRKGSFSRSVSLPNNVDSSKIKANFKNGLLELSIPKVAKTSRKTIKVT
ncbi:MAG: Hsp20/alpha crystallin family protein [Gammaproteobacteria bacterium]|nr:Hsp20/alpha crystallin family protein [Gammaproteobacteria bacterium]